MPQTRSNGEGTIYRRQDGRYEGAIMLPTTGGMRKRIRKYGKTRKEAYDKLMKAAEQARQGILSSEQTWKVSAYLDYWLEHEKRRSTTRQRHESVVRLHLKPGLGHHRLDGLSVRVVEGFLDDLLAQGKSIATIHQVRKVLSAALTYAMRQELLARNVARLVELPRYRSREAGHWTADEMIRFLEVARPDPLYPAFALLTLYGLRRSEVIGIRWCDVDFDRGVLRIRQQVQRIDGELQQVELKTESSERDEPLLATARDVLLQQRGVQAAMRAEAGTDWQGTDGDNELVFTTKTGRPMESHNLARSFMRICEQHGLRRITVHGLRHSNATAQKDLDVHARDIQAILGHGDVRTTGIYEHVDLKSKRNALQKVEGRLFMSETNKTVLPSNLPSHQIVDNFDETQCTPKENTHLCWVGTFFGGSSQTRTGDTGLFKAIETSLHERLTSVNQAINTLACTWRLGCVAVKIAVNDTPVTRGREQMRSLSRFATHQSMTEERVAV